MRIACAEMVYHIFQYCIGDVWYRDSQIYSDTQFDAIMDRLASCRYEGIPFWGARAKILSLG